MTLHAVDLAKSYGTGDARVEALAGVSLSIDGKGLTAIVGPSGSGKSTLLHCLAGLAVPDSGTVTLDGTDLASLSDDERARQRRERMGFVFQRGNLVPSLTVAENVSAGLVLQGKSRSEITVAVAVALSRVGLTGRDTTYPSQLSGGQAQKVALARALAGEPQLVFADEPTGALDRESADEVLSLLQAAALAGTSVVVVSHDPHVADGADAVVRLRDGRRVE